MPVADWYEPATHWGHAVNPVKLAKVPTVQEAHVPIAVAARAVE